jgi:hypothetical protein
MSRRVHKPRVTKADLERAAEFLRMMGAKVASMETTPGKIKVVTTDGAGLTLGDEEESLDRELQQHIASRYGHG